MLSKYKALSFGKAMLAEALFRSSPISNSKAKAKPTAKFVGESLVRTPVTFKSREGKMKEHSFPKRLGLGFLIARRIVPRCYFPLSRPPFADLATG